MRILLSAIGSRRDVQRLVALGSHMKALGHEIRMCVPPDFREWIEGLGIPVTPIGPEVRKYAASTPGPTQPRSARTAEQWRQMAEGTVATPTGSCGGRRLRRTSPPEAWINKPKPPDENTH